MSRRRWIKLWTQEVLHGTTLKELEPDERAVWFELLCAAGDSVIPGIVCVAEDCGFTDEQLCKLLKVNSKLLQRGLQVLERVGKIKRNGANIIEICNFVTYQGSDEDLEKRREYMANYMKSYRKKHKSDPPADTE
jgi:transcription initiation factor IIE alpha subunit